MYAAKDIHVVILDDEPFMLKLLTRLLLNQGFSKITPCDNGQTALSLVDRTEEAPHLILFDLNMPGMDGVEFVRRLVEHHYAGSLILVSGEDERTLLSAMKLVQAHHIEVLGSLHKPVSPLQLTNLLLGWSGPHPAAGVNPRRGYRVQRLEQAIRQGELVNYYQPKVGVATGELAGVETLVRWQHPSDGLVFPDQFIDMAETHGLIDALTETVMAQAFADAAAWKSQGLPLKVAVNVSMDNLSKLEFAEFVTRQAQKAGLAPQMIVLEVTESRLMTDVRAPLEILTRLRLRRFRLSIDDFGTGHSSLTQLRDAPFEELKIDRGFVHGAYANETNRAIFFASLGLAKELNIEVVAEGVEDQADWDFLQHSGCDLAQGYFIAKPMPAADIGPWLRTWEKRRQGTLSALNQEPS